MNQPRTTSRGTQSGPIGQALNAFDFRRGSNPRDADLHSTHYTDTGVDGVHDSVPNLISRNPDSTSSHERVNEEKAYTYCGANLLSNAEHIVKPCDQKNRHVFSVSDNERISQGTLGGVNMQDKMPNYKDGNHADSSSPYSDGVVGSRHG